MSNFDFIFKKYYTVLFLYAQKFVADEEVAMDLVQDVFTVIWEKNKTELEEEYLKAYLFNSVKNACLNYIKHNQVVQKYQFNKLSKLTELEIQHFQTGERSLIEKENLNKIYQTIESLPDIYKEIIKLSRFERLKNKEIAEQLKIPVRTVETRLFRALNILREKLSDKLFHIFMNFTMLQNITK